MGPERAVALIRRAEALEARGDTRKATLLRRRALANAPGHPDAIGPLLEQATANENWVLASLLHLHRFESADPGEARAEIARGLARIERSQLGNPAAARDWLLRGAEEAPHDAAILEELIELERERGREETLVEHLQTLIQLQRDEAPVALLVETAKRLSAKGERTAALELLERASALDPDHTGVLDARIALLRDLDHIFELSDALERRAAQTQADPREHAAALCELGELLEMRLFDTQSALDAYRRAELADPGAAGVAEALDRLNACLDDSAPDDPDSDARAADALAALEREAEGCCDRERLAEMAREIERLNGVRGRPEAAIPWIERWVEVAPEDPRALRALSRLQEQAGQEDELLATLESLDRLLEPASQLPLRRRMAELCLGQGRPAKAELHYRRALQLEPTDLPSLAGRAEVLRCERGREADLSGALEALADQQPELERLTTLSEMAEIQEAAGDLAGAIDVLERAEALPGCGSDVTDRIDALLLRANQLEALLARLTLRAEAAEPGSAESVSVELRRAKLLLDALDRPDEAVPLFQRVLEDAPEAPDAAQGLERALRAGNDSERLADFLAERATRAPSPEERDRLRFECAVTLDALPERGADALDLFLALAEESDEARIRRESRRHAEALLERLERWPELRDHLCRRLESADERERVPLHLRLVQLCGERLDDEEGACHHLEQVIEIEPDRVDVWQRLAGRYEAAGRHEDWAHALESELACGPDPARELGLRSKLAELYARELDQPHRVRSHYERIFELDPSHSTAGEYLIEAYAQEGRHEERIGLLEARLAGSDSTAASDSHLPDRRTALRLQIAEIRETQLDDLEGAISALEVALEEVGPNPRVAEPLATAYRRAGYDSDLIELCQRAAAHAPESSERAGWWVRQGDARLAREEADEAAESYRRALTERPGDRAVEASLRELYRALARKQPLAELLETELEHLAGSAEIPVRLELVQLLRDGDRATALRHARRILELAPRHEEAYIAALSLCDSDEDRLQLVEERRDAARSAGERRDTGLERARLLAGPLARTDDAIEAYRELLETEPGGVLSRTMRSELAALLERQGRHSEWLEVWAALCRDADPETRREKIERAAEIAWDRISPEAALPWLERLRSEGSDEPSLRTRISHARRQLGREDALLRALAEEAEASPDPEHARRCQLERAQLLRANGEAGRALAALAEAGPSPEVLKLKETMERELGLHAERAATLETLLACAGGGLEMRRELAKLYSDRLAAPEEAIRHLEAALGLARDPGVRIEVLRSLAGLESRLGRVARWAERSEQELAALDPAPVFDDRRRELRRELALAYCERLAESDRALDHLRELLDSDDPSGLGSEEQLHLESACLELLRDGGQPAELERRLAQRLERDGGEAASWLELARLREETLRRVAPARDAYLCALEVAGDSEAIPALRGLRRTSEQLGAWSQVAEALETEIEYARDDTERGALLRALGDLSWHRLHSTTRASRCYAAALEANASDFAALRALERLLESMEDWRGAIDLYESEAEELGSANPNRRREIWLRVATLCQQGGNDPERARRALERAAEIECLDTNPLRDLADLQDAAGDREAFVQNFALWCDAEDSPATSGDHLRLAEALEALGRVSQAAERTERALAAEPEHALAWETLARLRAAEGDLAASAEALQCAAQQLEPGPAAERLLEAAEKLGEDRWAHGLLREAALRAPDHLGAQCALAQSAARLGLEEEAELAAATALALPGTSELDPAEAAAVARLGAEAARTRGRHDAAAGFYAEALRFEPDHAEALAGHAVTLIELGDSVAARDVLERRLALDTSNPERALHLALLGRCLERADRPEDALAAYGEALSVDPLQAEALEACARVHEDLEHFEAGVAAIERWARAAPDGAQRAARLMRAAEWELRRGDCAASAAYHLRQITTADPDLSPAWIALATLQLETGDTAGAIQSCDRGASRASEPGDLATLAALQGQALEARGDRREAAECFEIAWESNPRRADAALAHARLLRGFGDWSEAAATLSRFGERHPDRSDPALAEVFDQLGRLRAGPLEDLDGAVLSYRRAIELNPKRLDARASLAELLSHRPGDRDEALEHVRAVLQLQPTHTGCLRVALRLARGRSDPSLAATGIGLQRALGIASAYEQGEEAGEAAPFLSSPPTLADARFETLRALAVEASDELATALEGTAAPARETRSEDPVAALRERMLAIQGELSAPALVACPSREGAEAVGLLAQLLLEPDAVEGDGQLVNALSRALSRRRRRKLRRMLPESAVAADYACFDWESWRVELRALAAAEMLRRDGTALRSVLVALLAEPGEPLELDGDSHLAPRAEGDPVARNLLARVVQDWMSRL